MDSDLKAIGARIRRARERKGFSQSKLAEMLQISEPHMSDIERGKTSGNMLLIKKLANILGVSADWLLLVDNERAIAQTSLEIAELVAGCTQTECDEIFKIMKQVKSAFDAVSMDNKDN